MGGTDKAFLPLAGRPLIAHVIDRLGCAQAISANGDPARFAAFGLPVLADDMPDRPGPLAGVLAGLDWAATQGASGIATAATDTPFFPRDCAERLAAGAATAGASIAMARGMTPQGSRRHPTFAWWSADLRESLRQFLTDGGRKVGAFAEQAGVVDIDFPGDEPFLNINTPDDLIRAAELAPKA